MRQGGRGLILRGAAALAALLIPFGTLAATPFVSAGGNESHAVKADGSLWVWGADDAGNLGIGRQLAFATPATINGISTVRAVSAGFTHVLAVRTDGTVWAWGDNAWG